MEKKRMQNGDLPYKVTVYREICSVEEFVGTLDKNDDQYMVHRGVVLEKIPPEDFRIETSLIPDHVRDDLAAATLDFVRMMRQAPGTRENENHLVTHSTVH